MHSYLGREEWFAVRGAVRREHGVVPLGLRIFSLELGDVRLAQAVKACLDHMTKSYLHGARRVVYVRYVERLSSCPEKWMPCRQPLRHRLRATTR